MIRNQKLLTLYAGISCALLSLALCSLAPRRAQATQILVGAMATNVDGATASWIGFETLDPVTGAWSIPGSITLQSADGSVVGEITNLSGAIDADPSASVTFGVVAGSADTSFTIVSSVVSFAPLTDPVGTAGASVTVTDFNNSGSASLVGQYPGPFSFEALYNGANVFTSLDGPATVSSVGGSNTQTGNVLSTTIPGAVSSIQALFSFTLSAHDLGSGTGTFTVSPSPPVPEPSTLGLLAIGSVVLLGVARRRSNKKLSR